MTMTCPSKVPVTLASVFRRRWPVIVRELGAVNIEIDVLGAVRRTIEEHQAAAFENA